MAAISYPVPGTRPRAHAGRRPPDLRVARPGDRPAAGAYRRRRIVASAAAVAVLLGLLLLVRVAVGALGSGTLTAPGPSTPSAAPVHVVQPGETVWSIARQLQPHGDVRPLVDRLVAVNGGSGLVAGERLTLR